MLHIYFLNLTFDMPYTRPEVNVVNSLYFDASFKYHKSGLFGPWNTTWTQNKTKYFKSVLYLLF